MKESTSYVIMTCKDLGQSAFIKMKGFRLKCRRGREFDFEVEESGQEEFKQLLVEYANSAFCEFDNCIMTLKRLPER